MQASGYTNCGFAKAFEDAVQHDAFMKVFKCFGFHLRWLMRLQTIMPTGFRQEFFFARGQFVKEILCHHYYL
jgi:hypothetical protein